MDTTTQLKQKIVELHGQSVDTIRRYFEYADTLFKLVRQHHSTRLQEVFPNATFQSRTLLTVLDLRLTPKSLEDALNNLKSAHVELVVEAVNEGKYYVFGISENTK